MSYPRLTKSMPDETRPNPFHLLHKALRFGHCRMIPDLGVHDFGDDASSAHLLAGLVQQIDLFRAAAEARQQALADAQVAICQNHAAHMAALAELDSLVRAVTVAAPQRRRLAGRGLYRCYALYASADMARMDEDETLLLTALHAALADEALRALEGRIFVLLMPAHATTLLRLLLPGLASGELNGLMGLLESQLDPSCFARDIAPVMSPLLAGVR